MALVPLAPFLEIDNWTVEGNGDPVGSPEIYNPVGLWISAAPVDFRYSNCHFTVILLRKSLPFVDPHASALNPPPCQSCVPLKIYGLSL